MTDVIISVYHILRYLQLYWSCTRHVIKGWNVWYSMHYLALESVIKTFLPKGRNKDYFLEQHSSTQTQWVISLCHNHQDNTGNATFCVRGGLQLTCTFLWFSHSSTLSRCDGAVPMQEAFYSATQDTFCSQFMFFPMRQTDWKISTRKMCLKVVQQPYTGTTDQARIVEVHLASCI